VEELARRRFILPALGRGIFSPVYIDDLVDGIVGACGAAGVGGVFTLTDGVGVTTREFFGFYARLLGRRLPVLPTGAATMLASATALGARAAGQETEINAAAARYLARTGTYAIDRARAELGYEPRVGLAAGMERTAAWLRAEGFV
jgi:nucleoside-diphosphate-sugar epimerase